MSAGTISSRLARRIVGWYPQPWRARYEDELVVLLHDADVRWRDVIDLLGGALSEWRVELLDPERHRHTTWLWVMSIRSVPYVIVAALMWRVPSTVAAALTRKFGEAPDWLGYAALIAAAGVGGWGLRHAFRATRRFTYRSRADAALCVLLALAAWSIIKWNDPEDSSPGVLRIYSYFVNAHLCLMGRRKPAFMAPLISTSALREQLKWARLELARQESLANGNENAELANARQRVHDVKAQLLDAFGVVRTSLTGRATPGEHPSDPD